MFQDVYNSLNADLAGFNATLNALPKSGYPVLNSGNLKNADSNAGPQLANPGAMSGIQLQLQELKALGVKAVMVQVGFPMLYEPFLTSQGQTYAQFVTLYQQIAAMIHGAGLKLIVENDTLLTNDVQAGWDAAPFYATLDWTQYQQARAQTALTIAQTMQPDYIVVLEEPTTEANNTGQTQANTVAGSYSLLSQILASVRQAGVPGMMVGAGTGTAQANALSFIQEYVTLPLDFIDFHIYPINDSYLPIAMGMVNIAGAAGLPVAMTECWLWKVRDDELGVLTNDEIRARDPFDFWEPLDEYFIQTMQNLSRHAPMLFMDPFGSTYWAAYLPYDDSTETLTPTEILNEEGSQASQNMGDAMFTSTAMSYYSSLVTPPDSMPPAVPAGVAGSSNNPNAAALSWSTSPDNVGVAGYNILRNGSVVGTTANLYYQDLGLTSSTTYSYGVEAFDLAGNISVPSPSINVTTADVTPPSAPANVAATASSCQKVQVTWSPSTDNQGVGSYLVFWGISPAAVAQIGRTPGAITAYTSYPLTCGTTYYYGVEAVDTSGNASSMSTVISVTTPLPPSAPDSLAVTVGSASKVSVTWSGAASGGLPVQHYHVFRGATPSGMTQVALVAQTSYVDRSVSASTTYYYGVEAADSGGDLSPMSPILAATTPTPPLPPGNVSATAQSAGKVTVTWSAATGGTLPVANYRVYRGDTMSDLIQIGTTGQTSYKDVSVTAGASYYYAVAAADSDGDLSGQSGSASVSVPTQPQAPTGLMATAVSTTAIGVTWSTAVNGGPPIQSYRVWRGASISSMSQVAVVTTTSYTDKSLSPATTYYYGVEAADIDGDVSPMSGATSAATLTPPSAPTNLAVTPTGTTTMTLNWAGSAMGSLPVQDYRVWRGATAASLSQVAAVTKTAYTDKSLIPGTTYYYAIVAADTSGDPSPMSQIVPAATLALPSAPTNLAANSVSASQVSLTWTAAQSGLPLASYSIYRGSTPDSLTLLKVVGGGRTAYTDYSLSAETTYYYAASAADTGHDVSALSDVLEVTTSQ